MTPDQIAALSGAAMTMAEHKKNARPSNEEKHQQAEKRRKVDQGKEEGDKRRKKMPGGKRAK